MQHVAYVLNWLAAGRQTDLRIRTRHVLIKPARPARACPRIRLTAALSAAVRRPRVVRVPAARTDRPAVD